MLNIGREAKELAEDISVFDYDKYLTGGYFVEMLHRSDPRLGHLTRPNVEEPPSSTRYRLVNLDFVLRQIRRFYQVI